MMRRWINCLVLTGAVAALPVQAATIHSVLFDLKRVSMKAKPDKAVPSGLHVIFDGEDWAPLTVTPPRIDDHALAATEATTRAVVATGLPMARVDLDLQALAGHRSFDTMTTRQATLGLDVVHRGNALGIGTTGTYGIRLARAWRFTPFVSLDYNRIDSARYVDTNSPRPFMRDNADTGFTGSAGATLSHRFGAERRFRAVAFGAVIAATEADTPRPREFGSIGARVVNALKNSSIEAIREEVGLGLDYRLNPRASLSGAFVQTIDRNDGDAIAAKLSFRVAL
jgi:Autotransporter beta-domain